jgi:hypothetical protein
LIVLINIILTQVLVRQYMVFSILRKEKKYNP